MASKATDDNCNTETEEGTIALQKKRSRRVSFAEITSVHVFDRDDEYETPLDSKPSSNDPESAQSNEGLEFLLDSDSSLNGEKQEENDDELDVRRAFFRPIESPSPGSTIGSATSNDEDNFFGPVSASFIRPGRLSDSAVSNENQEMTMDSTAFSMHFRSLARSESGGDLKTPTGVHLSFVEKTPTQNALPTDIGSSMVLMAANKPISGSSTSVDKLSSSSHSNDMSLVGESPHKYDYGRLSPGLDALLAEGRRGSHAVSDTDKVIISDSTINMKSRFSPSKKHDGSMELNDGRDKNMGAIETRALPAEAFSFSHKKLSDANGLHNFSPVHQITYGLSSQMHNPPASDVLPFGKSNVSDALELMLNLDFNAVNCGTRSNLDQKVKQIDMFAPHENEFPLAWSMSSLSAKQRRIVLDSATSAKNLQFTTPTQKQSVSFVRDETRKQGDGVPSIQKSISKLEMLQASPFSSTFRVNINSRLISSEDNCKTPLPDTNREDAQIKCLDTSAARSEDQLLIVAQESGEQKYTINMDAIDIENSQITVDVSHTKGSTGVAELGIYPSHMSPGVLCPEQPIKLMKAEETLLPQFTWSGNKILKNPLSSGDPTKGTTSGAESSLLEITLDHAKDKKSTGTPPRTAPSSEKNRKKSSLLSKEKWGSLSRNAGILTTVANKLESLFTEREQSSSTIIDSNHSNEFTGVENTYGREINLLALQDEFGAVGHFQTPLTDKATQNVKSIILDGDLHVGTDPVRLRYLTMGGVKASSCGSASLSLHRGDNEPPHQKEVVELFTRSSSKTELHHVTGNDKLHKSVVEDIPSPSTSQLMHSFEKNSTRKRTREDMIPWHSDFFAERAKNRSPKNHKSEGFDEGFFSEPPNENYPETSAVRCETRLEHCTDVLSKFSADTQQLISPSTDKLSLLSIGVLEDALANLRRLQVYKMLCTDIRSQKSSRNLSDLHHKRIAEAKMLLHRFVLEQAKLELMCVKREKLLKKLQVLNSGIQESQLLKLNSLPLLSVPWARDAHVGNGNCQSVNFEGIQAKEGADDKVAALRQVLDISEGKIMSLTKSFHSSCKIKGEPNCVDTILLVNDHLKKKACCRFIRLDLQLWDVDNLENTNGHRNIALNYLGFISQRIAITVGPDPSIVISNKLNDVNILKNFPNMDVCTAFAFVLTPNTTQKYVGSRSLIQETQVTSSLLGNLLDVVEEIQVARVELQDLTYTNFRSPSVERLELHLQFMDFKSGRKVALTLDMSCLKWGIYPSEATPSLFESPANVFRKPLPEPHSAEIRAAAQSLRTGYLRIVRLCRCVSQLVRSWNGSVHLLQHDLGIPTQVFVGPIINSSKIARDLLAEGGTISYYCSS